MTAMEILATGPRALVEDLGRPGLARLGVGRSGAADRASHGLAQRIVGNPEDAAGIEVTLGGLRFRSHGASIIAVTGAPCPISVDGQERSVGELICVPDGAEVSLGAPSTGLRSYVAVRGGIDVEPELGSRSTDTMSGLGPPALEKGTFLPVGEPSRTLPGVDAVALPPLRSAPVELRILPGPRVDWITTPDAVTAHDWQVSSRSDRIGVRLEGEPIERHPDHASTELPSEGVVRGSLQVPPGGEPVLFLADHPVTGGYPVAAVVIDEDVDRAAQLRPGDQVRLRWEGAAPR
ncbi:MAG: biotin-dependent carboxyltransferase family protein [Mobilicoccus sp.]|nr:biotin-dependent carboxyltransferase family protein [Mobilicoccus sp.]